MRRRIFIAGPTTEAKAREWRDGVAGEDMAVECADIVFIGDGPDMLRMLYTALGQLLRAVEKGDASDAGFTIRGQLVEVHDVKKWRASK